MNIQHQPDLVTNIVVKVVMQSAANKIKLLEARQTPTGCLLDLLENVVSWQQLSHAVWDADRKANDDNKRAHFQDKKLIIEGKEHFVPHVCQYRAD